MKKSKSDKLVYEEFVKNMPDFAGVIRHTEFDPGDREAFGFFRWLPKNRFDITLTKNRNKTALTYAMSLYHEMMHLFLGILEKAKIIPKSDKLQHDFIQATEGFIGFWLYHIYVQRISTLPKNKKGKYRC